MWLLSVERSRRSLTTCGMGSRCSWATISIWTPKLAKILQKDYQFLVHIIAPERVIAGSEKMTAVQEWASPKGRHELGSCVGLCAQCRWIIAGFADVSMTLTKLKEESGFSSALQKQKLPFGSWRVVMYVTPPRTSDMVRSSSPTRTQALWGMAGCCHKGWWDRILQRLIEMRPCPRPTGTTAPVQRELLVIVNTLEHLHKYNRGKEFHLRT
jgi:hypothetical protein